MQEPFRADWRAAITRLRAAARGDLGEQVRAAAVAFILERDLGFTELCLSAGLDPATARIEICRLVREALAGAAPLRTPAAAAGDMKGRAVWLQISSRRSRS